MMYQVYFIYMYFIIFIIKYENDNTHHIIDLCISHTYKINNIILSIQPFESNHNVNIGNINRHCTIINDYNEDRVIIDISDCSM